MLRESISMLHEYRRDYIERAGFTLLEETETEILVGRWKPLTPEVRSLLETYHGKRVHSTVVDPADPAVRLTFPQPDRSNTAPDDFDPGAEESVALAGMGRRTRNLPPGEELLRRLLGAAVEQDASDLALWKAGPYRWRCTIRTGGSVRDLVELDERPARTVLRLLKLNGGLDLMEERLPQDGRIEFPWLPGRAIRIATVGDPRGEALALRFLDRRPRCLGALGLRPVHMARILTVLAGAPGLLVCCGPTGSGKTTTIAAIAEIVARTGRKVVSVEDPVEYRVPGVLQLESGGQDHRYLPAALRQDPDVLWIGEVRKRSHIRPLMEAVLSGHLVLTTLHAEGTVGVVQRLVNLGASEQLLRQHLTLVCTQRLEGNPPRLNASIGGEFDGSALVRSGN
ncbi:MAG: hypothetical protein EA427_06890 [Spirochaetaceae bacterium]|nr:MAG: hypothetical protein EA427_06890 [Spirochaetaceae bacterium]